MSAFFTTSMWSKSSTRTRRLRREAGKREKLGNVLCRNFLIRRHECNALSWRGLIVWFCVTLAPKEGLGLGLGLGLGFPLLGKIFNDLRSSQSYIKNLAINIPNC